MLKRIYKWVRNLFTEKGFHYVMPAMHLKAVPIHNDIYIVEVEGDGGLIQDEFIMNDVRICEERKGPVINFCEEMLQPGYRVWLNDGCITLWTSYFAKFRIQIRHKETGEVYMGWQLMDCKSGHP